MNQLLQKNMGLGAIAASAIFLFHPIIAFVDVLPDLIGYLLLWIGTYLLADLNGHMAEAKRRFCILFAVGAGQLVASAWVYRTLVFAKEGTVKPYEAPTTLLLLSFALLVLQICFLLPAMRELFAGLESLETRFDRKGSCKATARLKATTPVLLTIISILSALPEASILTSYEADKGNPLFRFDWYRYITLFRILAAIIALIIGTVWLVQWMRVFYRMCRDCEWLAQMRTSYLETVVPQTGMFAVRRYSAAFLMLGIGTLFAVNLRINYHSVLPGIGLALFAVLAAFLLKEKLPYKRQFLWSSAALALCSVVRLILNARYLVWYLPEASLYEEGAYYVFLVIRILDGIEAVLTLLLIGILLYSVNALVKRYARVDYGNAGDRERELSHRATEKLQNEFRMRIIGTEVLFSIAAILNVGDAVFRFQLPWLWSVAFVFSAVGIWQFFSLTKDLLLQIQNTYASDGTNKNL